MTAARRRLLIDVLLILGAFVLATLVAEAAGAANLGTAMTFGQIGVALAVLYIVMKR
jgi:hypothetical protein